MSKLKIFGIDGFDYLTIRENLEDLPKWKKLVGRYPLTLMWTDMEDVRRPWKFDSAMLWTSIFTGKLPGEHGIWGYKEGIDGRPMRREDVKAKFLWENEGIKFMVFQVPAVIPPLSWGCEDTGTGEMVASPDEWCEHLERVLGGGVDFDVFISVFSGSDDFQHHNWDNHQAILDFYEKVGDCLLRHLGDEDDALIISDHGFTDIETAVSQMWTWRYSKMVNRDVGHHAPWGICATNLRWRPFKVSDVYQAVARHLLVQGLPIKYEW